MSPRLPSAAPLCSRRDFPSGIEPLEARIAPAAVTWIKNGDGYWDDATNWSNGLVPGTSDDVTLGVLSTAYHVTIRSGNREVHSLTVASALEITAGTLILDNASTVSGALTLNGGTIAGVGALDITSGGTLSLNGTLTGSGGTHVASGATATGQLLKLAGGRNFLNDGLVSLQGITVTGSGTLSSTITNDAGATLNLLPNAGGFAGASGRLMVSNAGTLHVDASGAFGAEVDAGLVNSGLVTVSGGTAVFNGVLTSTGEFHADPGATLQFYSTTLAFNAGSQFTGAGLIRLTGGVTTIASGVTLSAAHLRLDGAELHGPGFLAAPAGAQWELGGETLKNLAAFTIASGAVVQSGTNYQNFLTLNGTSLTNSGQLSFQSSQSQDSAGIRADATSSVTNEASGTLTFSAGSGGFGNSATTVINRGLLVADPGSGQIFTLGSGQQGSLDNSGTFSLQSGTGFIGGQVTQLSTDHATLTGGHWQVSGGGQLSLGAAIQYAADSSTSVTVVENDADVTVTGAGSTFNAVSHLSANGGRLAVLTGAGLSTASGPFANSGTLEIGAGSTVSVPGSFTQTSGGSLVLHLGGTVASGQFGLLQVTGAATLGGGLELQVDGETVPKVGDVYAPLHYGSASGDFVSRVGIEPQFQAALESTRYSFRVLDVPADLQAAALTVPASGVPGASVTVSFTVQNVAHVRTGANHWTDSIYLSPSGTFDGHAVLLGRVTHQGVLGAQGSYSGSLTACWPALPSGDYHAFLVADSRDEVPETDSADNLLVASSTVHLDVPTLSLGTPLSGTVAAGQDLLFQVHLPSAAASLALTTALAGQAEISLQKEAVPTPSNAAGYAYRPESSTQQVTLGAPGDADYFVLIHGREGAGAGASFTLGAALVPFTITEAGGLRATNDGFSTLAIHGGQFTTATTFTLAPHSGSGPAISLGNLRLQDGTYEFGTADLRGAAPGVYDLQAVDGTRTATLAAALTVLPAPLAELGLPVAVSLSAPETIRVGEAASVVVTYRNTTGHDVAAPTLRIAGSGVLFTDPAHPLTTGDGALEFVVVNPVGPAEILPAGFQAQVTIIFQPETAQAGLVSHLSASVVGSSAVGSALAAPRQSSALAAIDLASPAGAGRPHFVSGVAALPYTVHFENGAAAGQTVAEVKITTQLDAHLDWSSFQLGAFSFAGITIPVPAGHSSYSVSHYDARSTLGVYVDFQASLNEQTGVVTWDLKAIDPATGDTPASGQLGFLRPNNATGRGEGTVSYTVQPKASLSTGDLITAQAKVTLDASPVVTTSTVTNTVDAAPPASQVNVLPALAGPDLSISWTGTDATGGSGIASYDVYVSEDGGAYQPLVLGTKHTASLFAGVPGHQYSFFSVATDFTGRQEAQPAAFQASVSIQAAHPYTVDAAHPGHFLDANGKPYTVTLTGHGSATVTLAGNALKTDHADLRAITLSGTDATSVLTVTAAKGETVQVDRITATSGSLRSVTLGAGVTLGDGLDDGAPDLQVGGTLGSLTLSDLHAYALLQVGDGLSASLAAKAAPLPVSLRTVLGEGVEMDFATKLGTVRMQSWAHSGLLHASLGGAGLTATAGDFAAGVEVAAGNLGPVSILGGSLTSPLFSVPGSLASLTVKGALEGEVAAGSIGPIVAGGFSGAQIHAESGGIGNILSTASLHNSTVTAAHGKIGNFSVQLTAQTGTVNAFDTVVVSALGLGNVTASVSGGAALLGAHGFLQASFTATNGNIGATTATVSGSALTDAAAIESSTFQAPAGNIGSVSARATAGSAAPLLGALRDVSLSAHGNLGAITAIAQATSLRPTGGTVIAVQQSQAESSGFTAGGSIGAFTVLASGSALAKAISADSGLSLAVSAGAALGPITLTTNAATGKSALGAERVHFSARTTIGAVAISGNVTGDQLVESSLVAGGRIASVSVSAKTGANGTLERSTVLAGQSHALATAADLLTAGLGSVIVSGSVLDSQIAAVGNLGPLKVGQNLAGSLVLAGIKAGPDGLLLTADDTVYRASSLASLTVLGAFATTSVAAGIDSGADGHFGGSDDHLGLAVGAIHTLGHLGPLVFGAATVQAGVSKLFLSNPALSHVEAIEAATLTSITVSKLKSLANFSAPVTLSSTGMETAVDVLIRQLFCLKRFFLWKARIAGLLPSRCGNSSPYPP